MLTGWQADAAGVSSAVGQNFISTVGGGLTAFQKTTSIALTPNDGGSAVSDHGPIDFIPAPGGGYSETEDYTFTFLATAATTQVQTNDQIVGLIPEPVSLAVLIGLGMVRVRRRR